MNKPLMRKFLEPLTEEQNLSPSETVQGKYIVLSVAESEPFVSIKRYPNGTIRSIRGYLADVWDLLQEELQFRTILVESTSGYLGQNTNGTWSGIIGDLQMKKADVGLANLAITPERQSVVDFSPAIYYDSSQLLAFSSVKVEAIDWMMFIRTLPWITWCYVAAFWFCSSLLLIYLSLRESKEPCYSYFFYLFGAITMQGCACVPETLKGRVVFISFWAMCVLVHAHFTAYLTTNLTAARPRVLSSLKEALDEGFQISVIEGTQQHLKIFELAASDEDFRRVTEKFKEDESLVVPSFEDGIRRTYDGKTLFMDDSIYLRLESSENCSLTIQPMSFFPGFLHLPYSKHFEFKEILDQRILLIHSSGMLQRLAHHWFKLTDKCEDVPTQTPSLGLTKTSFVFAVVFGGIFTSLFLFVIEVGVSKWRKK